MIPEIGCIALIIALCLAGLQLLLPLVSLRFNQPDTLAIGLAQAKCAAKGQFAFLMLACLSLIYAFVSNDFSVLYVAQNSNSHLPLIYRIAALWGAHEGSLLLWVTLLGLWTFVLTRHCQALPLPQQAYTFVILGLISMGFILFMLTTSNPFTRLLPQFPVEGQDLNPLLQDPGLASHPPMLYMGYVGFAISFALTLSALLTKQVDTAWARFTRPWVLAAWGFLSLGIVLGSWWAYRELGWGGWWFWDPVENASFMPWLAGTALLHTMVLAEKRDTAKAWAVLIAICAFALSLMGTFLVRSGVLISVHAFANDPARGAFMLKFLLLVIGGSLTAYAWRAPAIQSQANYLLLSRETGLLANTILLMVSMASILLGTLYPLLMDVLHLHKLSVGAPYFNSIFVPIFCGLLVLMGYAPHLSWQQTPPANLMKRLQYVMLATIVIGGILPWLLLNKLPSSVAIGLMLATWLVLATGQDFLYRCYAHESFWQGFKQISSSYYGMLLAHLGIAVCVIGMVISSAYSQEAEVIMEPGENVQLAGYSFYFAGTTPLQGSNYTGLVGQFLISKNHDFIARLPAQKRLYTAPQTLMTEAAIVPGLWRDLYIALGDQVAGAQTRIHPHEQEAWSVRIYYKPMVRWIWFGGLIMLAGGWLAASDKKRRQQES